MKGEFTSQFRPRYQRNNKRTGQKNIRCFPSCTERAHQSSGFCGQVLSVNINGLAELGPNQVLRSWGEFIQCGSDEESLAGSTMTLPEAILKERSRTEPLRPWMRGEIGELQDGQVEIVFNRQLLGWHYDWTSTKHTCDSFHSFKAHVFVLDQPSGRLAYVGSVLSPQFQLYSRRRQQQMYEQRIAEEAAAAAAAASAAAGGGAFGALAAGATNALVGQPFPKMGAKRAASGPPLGVPPQKQLLADSDQIKKRRQRNLILDRLMRFLLTHGGGAGIGSMGVGSGQPVALGGDSGAAPGGVAPGGGMILYDCAKLEPGEPVETNGTEQLEDFSSSMLLSWLGDGSGVGKTLTDAEFDALISSSLDENNGDERLSTVSGSAASESGAVADIAGDDIGQDLLVRLKAVIEEKGNATLRSKGPYLLEILTRLPDAIISVSSNRRDFANFIARWSSPAGIKALKYQFEEEKRSTKLIDGFVNADEEDAGDPGDRRAFESVYASMRNLFRNVVMEALSSLGGDLDDFLAPMELAAKYRLLNADPFYPPSRRVAAMTHLQLYGSLSEFARQDFGSRKSKFSGEPERLEWVSAYWKVRRKVFRRLIVNRIIEERRGVSLPKNVPPIDSRFDISGVWFNCTAQEHSKVLVHLTKKVGMSMGDMSARLFETMWKRVEIKMNRDAMHVQGERVLLANPSMVYMLDKRPHRFTLPNPLPISAWNLDRTYVAWISEERGRCYINVVNGGPTRASHVNEYLTSQSVSSEVASASENETMERLKSNAEVRLAKRYWIAPDRETLYMSNRIHFFGIESAPSFDDFVAVEKLCSPGLDSEVAYHTAKHIRVYDSPDLPDDLLDLLVTPSCS